MFMGKPNTILRRVFKHGPASIRQVAAEIPSHPDGRGRSKTLSHIHLAALRDGQAAMTPAVRSGLKHVFSKWAKLYADAADKL